MSAAAIQRQADEGVPFLQVTSRDCRWPLGDWSVAVEEKRCCGAPKINGSAYCAEHAAIAGGVNRTYSAPMNGYVAQPHGDFAGALVRPSAHSVVYARIEDAGGRPDDAKARRERIYNPQHGDQVTLASCTFDIDMVSIARSRGETMEHAALEAVARQDFIGEEAELLCRRVALFLLGASFGREVAASAYRTLPEAVDEARKEFTPIVASKALEVRAEAATACLLASTLAPLTRWSIAGIQRFVAEQFEITVQDMVAHRKTDGIVRPRQTAMFLCKILTPRSFPEIGKHFGGRDHTTVLHAVRKLEGIAASEGVDFGRSASGWTAFFADHFRRGGR